MTTEKVHFLTGFIFARGTRTGVERRRFGARCGTSGHDKILITDKPEETTCRRCNRFLDKASQAGLLPKTA